jgi:TonB family protein
MKSIFGFLFALLFSTYSVYSQVEEISEDIFVSEETPEYPGGQVEMQKFIASNMRYPQDAIEKNIQGKVYIKFRIDNSNGKIDSISVAKGATNCPMCDEEAIRVVKMMPNWNPVKGSEQKAYWVQLPITFVLDDDLTKIPSFSDEPNIIDDGVEITKRYDAHWAGFDIGTLILLSQGFNLNFENNPYWENNIGKSSSLNLNLFEYKLPIFKQYFGLTTGLGMAVSTIGFKDNYILQHNQDSVFALKDTIQSYRMNSLSAGYLTVPLLLEFASKPKQKKSFYVAAGVVGGLRFTSSTTKTGKYANGDRFQNVVRSKYNLNPITLDATVRAGYGLLGVYASYQLSSLFKNNKTVEIFPFKVGLTMNVDFFKKQKSNEDE